MSTYGNDVADEIMSIMLGGTEGETITAYELSEMTGWSLAEIRLALSVLADRELVSLANVPDYGTPAQWQAVGGARITMMCGDRVTVTDAHTGRTVTGTVHRVEPVGNGRSEWIDFQDGRKVMVHI